MSNVWVHHHVIVGIIKIITEAHNMSRLLTRHTASFNQSKEQHCKLFQNAFGSSAKFVCILTHTYQDTIKILWFLLD